jgi:hypothetical protein
MDPTNLNLGVTLPPGSLLGPNSAELQQALAALGPQLAPLVGQLEQLLGTSSFAGAPSGNGTVGATAMQGANVGPLSGLPIGSPPAFGSSQATAFGGVPYGGNSIYGFGNSVGNGFPSTSGLSSPIGMHFGNFNAKQPSTTSSGSTGSTGISSMGNTSFGNFSFGNLMSGGSGGAGSAGGDECA